MRALWYCIFWIITIILFIAGYALSILKAFSIGLQHEKRKPATKSQENIDASQKEDEN